MSVIKVPTNFNIDVEFEIPEFYKRLIALILDGIVLFFYLKIAGLILSAISTGPDPSLDNMYDMQWITILLIFVPLFTYHAVMEITLNGQSIGKKLMGLRVVDEFGGKASISQFLIRWLVRDIWFLLLLLMGLSNAARGKTGESIFLILAVIAYFFTDIALVVSSKKGQRIGDMLAKTILISTNTRSNIEETVFQEVADSYTPAFPQVMQLSDKDLNAIKSILETARRKGDFHMADAACVKIKAHLKIESSMGSFEFLETLLKDYNYLSVK
ncbi:MAG: RDD family protein [Bacteroidetes bacterium]|nr:RDD family protein [Bacteroidota bacterium]